MARPKLNLDRIWPGPRSMGSLVGGSRVRAQKPPSAPERGATEDSAGTNDPRKSRPKGSYYLREGWKQVVRSVYLVRILDYLDRRYREKGEDYLSNLALVWVSSDGSRELAIKGKALQEFCGWRGR